VKFSNLLAALQSELDASIAAPVLVAGSSERPMPAVFIEDWDVDDLTVHNSKYVGSEFDDITGYEIARYYHLYYTARIEFLIRDDDGVSAHELHDTLKQELLRLSTDPTIIGPTVRSLELGGGGGIDHQFHTPAESELNQTVIVTSYIQHKDESFDVLENIINEIEIVDSEVEITN
jgi:hypothetical protein